MRRKDCAVALKECGFNGAGMGEIRTCLQIDRRMLVGRKKLKIKKRGCSFRSKVSEKEGNENRGRRLLCPERCPLPPGSVLTAPCDSSSHRAVKQH